MEAEGCFTGDKRYDLFYDLCVWLKVRVGDKNWSSAARAYNKRYWEPPLPDKFAYDTIKKLNQRKAGADAWPDTIKLGRLQMFHGDPTCWILPVNDIDLKIDDILSQTEVRKKIARTGVVVPLMKPQAYEAMVQKLLDEQEVFGGDQSVLREGQIKVRLVDFCTIGRTQSKDDYRDNLLRSKVLVVDGRRWFRFKDFIEHLSTNGAMSSLQDVQLTLLRRVGGRKEPTEIIKGAVVEDLWSVPKEVVRGQTKPFEPIVVPKNDPF